MGMGRNKTISDDDLLDVARRAFVEEGFAASTREIARRAGVSEGLIFQRFQTKEDLFFAAMIPPPADLNRLLHHPRSKGRALIEKITFSMIDYFRDTLPVLLPLMSHPAFRFEEFAKRHPDSPMLLLRRQLVEFLVREQRAGRLGAVGPGAGGLLLFLSGPRRTPSRFSSGSARTAANSTPNWCARWSARCGTDSRRVDGDRHPDRVEFGFRFELLLKIKGQIGE